MKKDEHTSHYKTLTHSLGFIKNAQNIASHLLRSAQRLAAEKLMEEQTALAEVAARRAAEARMAAEEALKQMVNQGWKLGSDTHGRNYWYNWITGESTWTKPSGWKIKQVSERTSGNGYSHPHPLQLS